MLRLHFQSLLHARLQDTDMQIYMVLGVGFVFLQMCSIKVNMHWKKKALATNCVFLSAGGSSTEKKPSAKPSSWTLNFTVVAAFLCLSFWCYLQSKGSKAWSVAWGSPRLLAWQPVIYAKVYAKKRERGRVGMQARDSRLEWNVAK